MQELAITQRPQVDDERTVREASVGGSTVPGDGVLAVPVVADHPLPYGTLIEGFRITGLIGEGGFGVVYRAWDDALERHVAIKEYMPLSLAVRGTGSLDVSVRSERQRQTFEAGRKSFVNEARLLARFDHPALVKVFRYWEANHTAYMAMPYYEGPTLKTALDVLGSPPVEETLRDWLLPLLDALSVLHRQNYYHRDIAPDNILLTASGPLLLDFGAARHVIGDMTQTITVVLKPGYAPIEQYGGDTFQGPWTDLYALAGVVRYAITGRAPAPSVERVVNDTLQPLATTHAGRYSDGFLRAIDTALAVRPEARPQDVAQFREMLNAGLAPDSPLRFRPSGFQHSAFQNSGFSTSTLDRLPAPGTPAATSAPARQATPLPADTASAPAPAPGPGPGPRLRLGLGRMTYAMVAIALLAAGGAVWWLTLSDAPAPAPAVARTPSPAPAVAPMPSPAPAPAATAPARTPAPALAPVPKPAPAPAAALAPAPAPTPEAPPGPAPAAALEPPPAPAPAPPPRRARAPSPPPPEASSAAERPKQQAALIRPAPESRRAPREEVEEAPTTKEGGKPSRCSDILQKASLEPLDPDEVAYLRSECR